MVVAVMEKLQSPGNPYLRLLYSEASNLGVKVIECPGVRFRWLRREGRSVDLLHLNWPSYYYAQKSWWGRWRRLVLFTLFLWYARLKQIAVVWTAHNLLPHDRQPGSIDRVARWLLLRQVNAVFAHRSDVIGQLELAHRIRLRGGAIPHMCYQGVYDAPLSQSAARDVLQIPSDAFTIVHLGAMRRNKNIDQLIRAFRSAARPEDVLLIAGSATAEMQDEMEGLCGGDSRIKLEFGHVPDERVGAYLAAADASVVAGELTTSGTMYLSLTFGTPVIVHVSAIPPELRGRRCFVPFDGSDAGLAGAISSIHTADHAAAVADAQALADQRRPETVSQEFISSLKQVLEERN